MNDERPLTAAEATLGMLAEVQSLCPDCRSPKQAATRHGYRCDPHRSQYLMVVAALRAEATREEGRETRARVIHDLFVVYFGACNHQNETMQMWLCRRWADALASSPEPVPSEIDVWWTPDCGHQHLARNPRMVTAHCPDGHPKAEPVPSEDGLDCPACGHRCGASLPGEARA